MRISIFGDDGATLFTTDGDSAAFQPANKAAIAKALQLARATLEKGDGPAISSITADIRACMRRIEFELGAHPAFTWAQTTLGWAEQHLKDYVAGAWSEPPPRATNARGDTIAPTGL